MDNRSVLIGFFSIMFISIVMVGCLQSNGSNASSNTGRTIFMVGDPSADLSNVSSIKITVDSAQAHSVDDGWVTVSSTAITYDLLALKASGDQVLLADVQLKEGTYNQVRLMISKVVVTDTQGDHTAKLPSNELKIVGNLVVNANTTSTMAFDFIASESLHMTGDGKYILTPVVQLETRERANVLIESDNRGGSRIKINNGNMVSSAKHGMDLDGIVGMDHIVSVNTNLTIDSDGKVRSHGMLMGRGVASSSGWG